MIEASPLLDQPALSPADWRRLWLLALHLGSMTEDDKLSWRSGRGGTHIDPAALLDADAEREETLPLAAGLSTDRIASMVERRVDPHAVPVGGHPETRRAVPVGAMLAAGILCDLFGRRLPSEVLRPGTITLLRQDLDTKETADREVGAVELALRALRSVPGWEEVAHPKEVEVVHASPKRLHRLDTVIEEALELGKAVVVIGPDAEALPFFARPLVEEVSDWSASTVASVMGVIRTTCSLTGRMAEDAVEAALPSDDALGRLPIPTIAAAFAGSTTTLEVADRLHDFAERTKSMEARPTDLVTLDDVHGQPEAVADLRGLLEDVRDWRAGRLDWGEVSASRLLHGPPGCGKTMIAAAVAGSAGLPLIATSYAECQSAGHMGDYLAAMGRRVWEAIRDAPSVFFLDEIDSYSVRGGGTNDRRYSTAVVNGLLTDLTKLAATPGVIVLAATNDRSRVDPAVTRAGRLDRHVEIGLPTRDGLAAILSVSLGILPGSAIDAAAARLTGLFGADAATVAKDALGRARRDRVSVAVEHLDAAVRAVVPDDLAAEEAAVAAHEAGHLVAIAALGLPTSRLARLHPHGGYVDAPLPPRRTLADVEAVIAMLLAGRAAEEMIGFGGSAEAGDGPSSDLERATVEAIRIETEYGLGKSGLFHAPVARHERGALPTEVRARVDATLARGMATARMVLEDNLDLLGRVAGALRCERELDADRIASLTMGVVTCG
ncbi:AAA family ATPase [Jannaschia sp. Os4]|uniref:AAA family ATPase n=1 Tax=Jannaschia sp. Os4 TaxID=2807617 RepID=UPI0019395CC2|nr:AAA family ATPase [Jannaschia sp. Os4]MBM2576401.1 AAA family ATPase [Jannaschia sp. Os4]